MNFKKNLVRSLFVFLVLIGLVAVMPAFAHQTQCQNSDYSVGYRSFINWFGWQPFKTDGQLSGTYCWFYYMKGVSIDLGTRLPAHMNVTYRVYDSDCGWLGWVKNGEAAGRFCRFNGMKGLQVKLTGDTNGYRVKYKVYVSGRGWTGWKFDGDVAGNLKYCGFIKAVKIAIVKPKLQYTLLASNSIYTRSGCTITNGHVAVINAANGPVLEGTSEIVMDNMKVEDGVNVYADEIKLKNENASLHNVYCNDIINYGTVRGEQVMPLELPLKINLPTFPKGSGNLPANAQDVTVATGETLYLPAGVYKNVSLAYNAVLIMEGGLYEFQNLTAEKSADILFQAPADVVIEKHFLSGENGVIGPQENTTVKAKDIVFYIKGINGENGEITETPEAAIIGVRAKINANFVVPNGTAFVKARTTFEGSVIAKDIKVDYYVPFVLNSPFYF